MGMISSGEMLEVRSWLKEAGQIALNCFNQPQVDFKHDNSPVTQADRDIESLLVERIKKAYPDHGILAEEGTTIRSADYVWALDPIDGTRAFSCGLPSWGIMVGRVERGRATVGVVDYPAFGTTAQDGHEFAVRGSDIWGAEVYAFLASAFGG